MRAARAMPMRAARAMLLAVALAAAFLPVALHAGPVDAANALRRAGCDKRAGVAAKLQQTSRLDAVARRWSAGGSLTDAVKSSGLRLKRSVALRVTASSPDAEVRRLLAERNCREVTDAAFREIGVARNDGQLWIVIASPYQPPPRRDAASVAAEVLKLTNQARASARRCGRQSFPAAAALHANAHLDAAALEHSRDMARRDYLEHEGSDGSMPSARATRAGYAWRLVGENVAGGPQSAREVVDGWLASPGHCANIMRAEFTEMGVGYAADEDARLVVYWTQLFARPR